MKRDTPAPAPISPGPATMRDVAAQAGVSTATVSRVLAGMNGVAREVRERVLGAVAKLNYQPNRFARGLRLGQSKVIGLIIPDLRNPFFTGVAHGVEDALYAAGYTMQLGNSDGQSEREQAQLRILRGEGVAGLVFIAGNRPAANYDMLKNWAIPVVAVDRSPGGMEVDLVCSNNRDGVRQAVAHLVGLGHTEIAMLTGPAGIDVAEERLGGYLDALRTAGMPVRDEFIIHSDFGHEGGHAAMGRLLCLPHPPRAVVVANNLMTLGAIQQVEERRLRIPEDVALVGFDDMPWAGFLRPPLTTVAQSAEELGKIAAQLLLERIKEPQRAVRNVVLPTRLVVRASCGAASPPPRADRSRAGSRGFSSPTFGGGKKPMTKHPVEGHGTTSKALHPS